MSQIFKSYRCSELLKGCNRLHNILGIALQISDWTLELPETLKSHKSADHSWPLPLHVDMCFFLSVSIFMWMTCHFLLNCVKTLSCSAISPFFSYSPQLLLSCPVTQSFGIMSSSSPSFSLHIQVPSVLVTSCSGMFPEVLFLLTMTSYTCLSLIYALVRPPAFQNFLFNFIQEAVVRGKAVRALDSVAHFTANLQCYFGQVISFWVLFVFCPLRI